MKQNLTIQARFTLALVFVICVNTVCIIFFVERYAGGTVRGETGRFLAQTAQQISDQLDEDMWTRSREMELFKSLNAAFFTDDIPRLQKAIDKLGESLPSFSWIGYTDEKGTVLASTGKILVGKSIANRPVFTEARDKPFVGDVHDAVMLAKLLPNPTGERMKFVDLSSPVLDEHGRFAGVFAAHLSWKWVREVREAYIDAASKEEDIDALIVSAAGDVLRGPQNLVGEKLDLAIVAEAKRNSPVFAVAKWPDGEEYLTAAAFGDGVLEYSGLGWTTLVRQPASKAFAAANALQRTIALAGLIIAVLAGFLGVSLSKRLARPLLDIIHSAKSIEAGEIPNIPPYAGAPEIETLTGALRSLIDNLRKTTRDKEAMEELAFEDVLTRLPNRAAFEKRVEELNSRPLR